MWAVGIRIAGVALAAAALAGLTGESRAVAAAPVPSEPVRVRVSDEPVARVAPEFLSVMVDLAQVVGGNYWCPGGGPDRTPGGSCVQPPFDFGSPRLRNMMRALAPAYLRLGGTKGDELYYDLGDEPVDSPPGRYKDVLTKAQWDSANEFASDTGMRIAFTLNAGVGPRQLLWGFLPWGEWDPTNATDLIRYTAEHHYPVAVWGYGNEPGYFFVQYKLPLLMDRHVREYTELRGIIDTVDPGARLAGPASAFWPLVGEWIPTFESFARRAGDVVDILSWHWYPQQSDRCTIRLLPASPAWGLLPGFLDLIAPWADRVAADRDAWSPGSEVWIHETGNAQCGGQYGLSDRFLAGFWWLDELGQAARRGTSVVVRTSVAGPDYALVGADLQPNPDYWNSLLWHRLMGEEVLTTSLSRRTPTLRTYAHCAPGGSGAATALLMNLDQGAPVSVDVAEPGTAVGVYSVTGSSLLGKEVLLNGEPLSVAPDGSPPDVDPVTDDTGLVEVGPASYAFVELPPGTTPACAS